MERSTVCCCASIMLKSLYFIEVHGMQRRPLVFNFATGISPLALADKDLVTTISINECKGPQHAPSEL